MWHFRLMLSANGAVFLELNSIKTKLLLSSYFDINQEVDLSFKSLSLLSICCVGPKEKIQGFYFQTAQLIKMYLTMHVL